MVSIINYGMGNIRSVQSALSFLGAESRVIDKPSDIANSTKIILPGVGNFKKAMENLHSLGLIKPLQEANAKKIPLLGICLGMQLLADSSDESGHTAGLGWISGAVKRFEFADKNLKIPHVGFSTTSFAKESRLFSGLGAAADFYYVHSFHFVCADKKNIAATTNYGGDVVGAVQNGHIFGTQFHPEKSQSNGLKVLQNFLAV